MRGVAALARDGNAGGTCRGDRPAAMLVVGAEAPHHPRARNPAAAFATSPTGYHSMTMRGPAGAAGAETFSHTRAAIRR